MSPFPSRLAVVWTFVLATLTGGFSVSRGAEPTAWTPELMMKVKNLGSVVPSPNGKRAAYVVTEAVMETERSE